MNKLLYTEGKKYERKVMHYTAEDVFAVKSYFTDWLTASGWTFDHCFRMRNTGTNVYWYVVVLRKEITNG